MVCWLAVDKNGDEYIYEKKPLRSACGYWKIQPHEYEDRLSDTIELPKGSIKKLIGRGLSWEDSPVELKEE